MAFGLTAAFPSIDAWLDGSLKDNDNTLRRQRSGILIYIMWNAWKERNRRIFEGTRLTYFKVAHLAYEEISSVSWPSGTSDSNS